MQSAFHSVRPRHSCSSLVRGTACWYWCHFCPSVEPSASTTCASACISPLYSSFLSCSLCVWVPVCACAPLWSHSLSNAALQSTSCILTQSLRHKWEHQNLSAVLHTVPREDHREVRGGWTNLFSVSLSSPPRFSPGLPVPSDRSRHRGRVWPGWKYQTLCFCILV